MDLKLRNRWCAELRSGNYKQGRGSLRQTVPGEDQDYFCCLGVLWDIYNKGEWDQDEDGLFGIFTTEHYENCDIDVINLEELPLNELDKVGLIPSLSKELMSMNDGTMMATGEIVDRYTFPMIADFIEENVDET